MLPKERYESGPDEGVDVQLGQQMTLLNQTTLQYC